MAKQSDSTMWLIAAAVVGYLLYTRSQAAPATADAVANGAAQGRMFPISITPMPPQVATVWNGDPDPIKVPPPDRRFLGPPIKV